LCLSHRRHSGENENRDEGKLEFGVSDLMESFVRVATLKFINDETGVALKVLLDDYILPKAIIENSKDIRRALLGDKVQTVFKAKLKSCKALFNEYIGSDKKFENISAVDRRGLLISEYRKMLKDRYMYDHLLNERAADICFLESLGDGLYEGRPPPREEDHTKLREIVFSQFLECLARLAMVRYREMQESVPLADKVRTIIEIVTDKPSLDHSAHHSVMRPLTMRDIKSMRSKMTDRVLAGDGVKYVGAERMEDDTSFRDLGEAIRSSRRNSRRGEPRSKSGLRASGRQSSSRKAGSARKVEPAATIAEERD
jgi:hypothetical protein